MGEVLCFGKTMNEILTVLLRAAGCGLIALALAHVAIARKLRWREEALLMSRENGQIFLVHAFFLCLGLALMGLPCVFAPEIFLEKSKAGLWVSASLAIFWSLRLYFQFFVYHGDLWRGKRLETRLHWFFSLVWLGLVGVFGACALVQAGLIR